jgi:6-phosphogluconolactonase
MAELQIEPNRSALIQTAADMAVISLRDMLSYGNNVSWVLAGGSTPLDIYKRLSEYYMNKVDWSKIQFFLGDERIVPLHDPQSNWQQISQIFLDKLDIEKDHKHRPLYELSAEEAAKSYTQTLEALKHDDIGVPRLDYLWLGIGEDGHTLSLFPGNSAANQQSLVVPVHDSPKPPPDRISLSLDSLSNVGECLIIVSGAEKSEAFKKAQAMDPSLPIVQAVNVIEKFGGKVKWLVDEQVSVSI